VNVYLMKGYGTSRPELPATGWSTFQFEAPPPPIYATGSVRSRRSARVSPPLAGVVSRVIPEKFSQVRAGDLLIELDSRQSRAALSQEKLALETAQVEEAGAREYLAFLEGQAARYKVLRDGGLVADSSYQEVVANARKQEYQANVLHKRVEAATLSVQRNQDQIEQMSIKSPTDGVVTDIAVTPGQFVAPGGSGDQASTLMTIMSLKDLNVQLTVDEIDVSRITVGQAIELKIDALPGKLATAKVRQIAKSPIAQQNGKPGVTYEVEMELLRYPSELTVGMSVFASIADVKSPGSYIPAAALQRDQTGCWVWLVEADKLHRQTVEPGEQRGDRIQLRSGLDKGATIVYGPQEVMRSLVDGQLVPRAN
ncbi:MAG TPA: efflux RND transporter periplasmic adaptor subunit, partial [Blastocatellia bacterium]|nr:efflux RND transporter periplasmic adaptor subunit [Blastocatellia bacterium]